MIGEHASFTIEHIGKIGVASTFSPRNMTMELVANMDRELPQDIANNGL